MKDDKKRARHQQLSTAAYQVLANKGYDGASMLSIAKAAKASNETLYRWYGDKKGLFGQLVSDNAAHTKQMLEAAIEGQEDPMQTLSVVAPVFLGMLLGERAILLNRAAAAEPTGELGVAISAAGRDVVQPMFETVMTPLATDAGLAPAVLTRWFLGLLVGDQQIKRVIGVMSAPTGAEVTERAHQAIAAFEKLLHAHEVDT